MKFSYDHQIGDDKHKSKLTAWGVMALSVISLSVVPVLFVWGGAEESPIVFVAVLTMWLGIGSLATGFVWFAWDQLVAVFKAHSSSQLREQFKLFGALLSELWKTERAGQDDSLQQESFITKLMELWRSHALIGLVAIGGILAVDYVLFAWALKFVAPPFAFMLFEMWPVWMTMAIGTLPVFQSLRRNDFHRVALWLAFVLCIGGVGIFSVGQFSVGQEDILDELKANWRNELTSDALFGIGLAFIAGLLGGGTVACTRRAAELLAERRSAHRNQPSMVFYDLVVFGAARVLLAVVLFFVALVSGEKMISFFSFRVAALAAAFVILGSILFRVANRAAPGYNINVVYYLMPILALALLFLVGFEDGRTLAEEGTVSSGEGKTPRNRSFLFIGSATIITGNLMAVFSVDRHIAFKGLVLSIWLFGAYVCLYEAPGYRWYYETAAAVITVFVLLLSFRVDRLIRRTQQEEEELIWLWQAVVVYAANGRKSEIREYLYEIATSPRVHNIQEAYKKLRDPNRKLFIENKDCTEVHSRIDMMVNSRWQGWNVGELTAIGILGLVAVGGLLIFGPEGEKPGSSIAQLGGIFGLFVELSKILLSATIVFLFFYILDLQNDRKRPIVDPAKEELVFPHLDMDVRGAEIFFALAGCLLILLAYGYVLVTDGLSGWSG